MTPQDLRQEFNSKYPEYVNVQTYPQVYTEWLEQKLIKTTEALDLFQSINEGMAAATDVCPKCGSEDIVTTIYCNKCNEAM